MAILNWPFVVSTVYAMNKINVLTIPGQTVTCIYWSHPQTTTRHEKRDGEH